MSQLRFKTSDEWEEELSSQFVLNSKKAWDQNDVNYSFYMQLISKEEFLERALASGVTWHVEKL